MVVMMDIEISCKGHCEKLSHFLDHVSHTVYAVLAFHHLEPLERTYSSSLQVIFDQAQFMYVFLRYFSLSILSASYFRCQNTLRRLQGFVTRLNSICYKYLFLKA